MKRLIAVILGSLVLMLGVAGCGASYGTGTASSPAATSRPGY